MIWTVQLFAFCLMTMMKSGERLIGRPGAAGDEHAK